MTGDAFFKLKEANLFNVLGLRSKTDDDYDGASYILPFKNYRYCNNYSRFGGLNLPYLWPNIKQIAPFNFKAPWIDDFTTKLETRFMESFAGLRMEINEIVESKNGILSLNFCLFSAWYPLSILTTTREILMELVLGVYPTKNANLGAKFSARRRSSDKAFRAIGLD